MTNRLMEMIYRVLAAAAPVIGFVLAMVLIYNVEMRMYPVISGWRLDYVTHEKDGYRIGGILEKDRACELISVSVMAVPKNGGARKRVYRTPDYERGDGDGPTGLNTWGPWALTIASEDMPSSEKLSRLDVYTNHRCHALWNQQTLLGSIPATRLQ